ncbi:hypothetical protein ACTFIU_004440 [Dictyostelium citrinum]
MGRSPEKDPLLGESKDPYSFMYPGQGHSSTLDISGMVGSDEFESNSDNYSYYSSYNGLNGGSNQSQHNNNQNNNNNSPIIFSPHKGNSGSIGNGSDTHSNNNNNNNNNNIKNNRNHNNLENSPGSIGSGSDILIGTTNEKMDLSGTPLTKIKKVGGSGEHKIGQLFSTAICGNDITSSIFYTASSCTLSAGKYAPISLLIVCIVLYLFRKVYGEVGCALPLNGGAYNVLLNTTSKQIASVAAALTMISYVATAVVSASTAMNYLQNLWEELNIFWATIGLLGFFALLSLIGITESAVVAFIIFSIHMVTLLILVFGGFGIFFYKHDWSVLVNNWNDVNPPDPNGTLQCEQQFYWGQNFAYCIYFGFGSAMLGVTGFETSSNFIEQQDKGVFPKTLRNMWAIVTFFNPLISVLSLCFLDTCTIVNAKGYVLATVANEIFGQWFHIWIIVDAVLVLSGSVLTSYVGFVGLVRRMSLDRCLPQFLIDINSCRKTTHWIIILFFLICSSLYAIVQGALSTLEGVYAVSFLGVMLLFAVGNMLLKYKRSSLKREIKAPWLGVFFASASVILGLIANIYKDHYIVFYFGIYFLVTIFIIMVMFTRARLLKMVLFFSQIVIWWSAPLRAKAAKSIGDQIKKINSQPIVFFASKDDTAYLNKAILYIRDNEQTNWVKVIHCYDSQDEENIGNQNNHQNVQSPPPPSSSSLQKPQQQQIEQSNNEIKQNGIEHNDVDHNHGHHNHHHHSQDAHNHHHHHHQNLHHIVRETHDDVDDSFSQHVQFLDGCYPKIRIDYIRVFANFTPSTVEKLSILLKVPKNFMFIACLKENTILNIGDLGGERRVP